MKTIFTSSFCLLFLFISMQLNSQTWSQKGEDIQGWQESAQWGVKVKLNVDGSIMAVSTPRHVGDSLPTGLLRVYQWKTNEWVQLGQDIMGAENDYLGGNMDMNSDGTKIVVAAKGSQQNGNTQGYLQVYYWNGTEWEQEGNNILGVSEFDFFGRTLAMSHDGNRIIAGSYSNPLYGWEHGLIRTYELIDDEWIQIGQDLHGEQQFQYFGSSAEISADGNIIAIGIRNDSSDFLVKGHVNVYQWQDENWVPLGDRIVSTYIQEDFVHDMSMSADGLTIAMGAPNNHEFGYLAGRAIVYEWKDQKWSVKGESLFCEAEVDSYGHSIALSDDGDKMAISGPFNDAGNPSWMHDIGHIRYFEWSGNAWIQTLADLDGSEAEEYFGYEISLSGDGSTLASGTPNYDLAGFNSGNVKVFGLTASTAISNLVDEAIHLHPNPAHDQIFLPLEFQENSYAKIYSEIGILVKILVIDSTQETIEIDDLLPGIYFLQLSNSQLKSATSFVKI